MAVHHIQSGDEVIRLFQRLLPFCDAKRAARNIRRRVKERGVTAFTIEEVWAVYFDVSP